ncbi:MAG: A/G-specific adenine glycosylase [Saprospiraceae bacterium]|nr:A/G-specific adenine glycosylase [Saprospiraceae bacterium]
MISKFNFASLLIDWSDQNIRKLSWRYEKDPYKIWISEIMLQQTRTKHVESYYQKFLQKFPNIQSLAKSNIDSVLQAWEGMGYYSRARNLHNTAQIVVKEFGSKFPATPHELIQLPGIGEYTSAAIASFAFEYPIAAIDGNVIRIITRVFGLAIDVNNIYGKKTIREIANHCLGNCKSSLFNQAMMDLGAQVCISKYPKCDKCPFGKICIAAMNEITHELPLKKPKPKLKNRNLHYVIVKDSKSKGLIRKRISQDIWKGLYEPLLFETRTPKYLEEDQLKELICKEIKGRPGIVVTEKKRFTHLLTHQKLMVHFYKISVAKPLILKNNSGYLIQSLKNFENFAFPRIVRKYINF